MNRTLIALSLLVGLALISCKKEKEGCMDADAKNYNSEATIDNGSCTYEGELVAYFNESRSNYWLEYTTATDVSFYVNDEFIGTLSVTDFSPVIPTCGGGDSKSVSTVIDLGSKKSEEVVVKAINADSGEWMGQRTLSISSGECNRCEFF